VSERRNKIFISYASADEEVANRLADCLKRKNKDIWFDKIQITWGDQIVSEINTGLSTSFMGIVVLSNNFFNRAMPQLELNSMIFLMNAVKFRILPLYHDINPQDLLLSYPLLSNIRGEKADQDCDALVSKLDAAISKARQVVEIPVIKSDQIIESHYNLDHAHDIISEVDDKEMKRIWTELTGNMTKYRKEATIAKLRHYSESRKIWKDQTTWEIISYLIHSDNNEDILNGLYIMEYIIKTSKREHKDIADSVIENAKERFASQLIRLIYPNFQLRISQDSFRLLKVMVEENILSKYSLQALDIAMAEINDDSEYFNYIQIYVWHFDNASKQIKKDLCDFMYDLTLKEDKRGKRAADLYNYFIKKT
jgi:TIR domain